MKRPLIGITAYTYYKPTNGWKYDVCYAANADAIHRAGGLPVLIPSGLDGESLRLIYERLDAVMLPGGGDIDPTNYDVSGVDDFLMEVDGKRDFAELSMAQWAIEDDTPLFGICRGVQVMNVALGGTLTADIPSMLDTTIQHSLPSKMPRHTITHSVNVEANTRLASIIGNNQAVVNSLHHQAIDRVGDGAVISAKSPDGIIEAIELPTKHFALAVQWHPEDLDQDERMRNLFETFVKVARERMD